MIHNVEDKLGLRLTQAQKEGLREHKIRMEIFKRQINSSENPIFQPKERHAIEIFLRSGCVDVTSNLPTLVGSFEEGNAGFAVRTPGFSKKASTLKKNPTYEVDRPGGYKQKRIYAQVVNHPERNTRCQALKNRIGWTAPFNYSSLVPGINVNDEKGMRAIQKAVREREYTWRKRREAGIRVRSPSGSPYASEDEQPQQPRQPRRQQVQPTFSLEPETVALMKHALDSEEQSPNTYNFQKYLQKYNLETQQTQPVQSPTSFPGFSGSSKIFKRGKSPVYYNPPYDPQKRLNELLKTLPPLKHLQQQHHPASSLATTVRNSSSTSSLATTVKNSPTSSLATTVRNSATSTSSKTTTNTANSFVNKLQNIFR